MTSVGSTALLPAEITHKRRVSRGGRAVRCTERRSDPRGYAALYSDAPC
ncbi:hypothetical protein CZ774_07440 [Frigoribacterium sp. JB110]|nr:hypothetical protein CZ774_07440 [Frigoribacterium sp. JB110]